MCQKRSKGKSQRFRTFGSHTAKQKQFSGQTTLCSGMIEPPFHPKLQWPGCRCPSDSASLVLAKTKQNSPQEPVSGSPASTFAPSRFQGPDPKDQGAHIVDYIPCGRRVRSARHWIAPEVGFTSAKGMKNTEELIYIEQCGLAVVVSKPSKHYSILQFSSN